MGHSKSFGHSLRTIGEVSHKDTVKASWIADSLGLSERAVRYARAAPVRPGQTFGLALLHGRLEGLSSDRLFRLFNALDHNMAIVIRRAKKRINHTPALPIPLPRGTAEREERSVNSVEDCCDSAPLLCALRGLCAIH